MYCTSYCVHIREQTFKEYTILEGNAVAVSQQAAAYAIRQETRFVGLFDWNSMFLYYFGELNLDNDQIGDSAYGTWVEDGGTEFPLVERLITLLVCPWKMRGWNRKVIVVVIELVCLREFSFEVLVRELSHLLFSHLETCASGILKSLEETLQIGDNSLENSPWESCVAAARLQDHPEPAFRRATCPSNESKES